MGNIWCPNLLNFKLWEVHGIESLRKDLYGKTMGRSCPEMFHSNGLSASLFFPMGMIWDHHIVQNNYGHHFPIGTPYQLLKHTCFTCSMEMVWDHLVTQENCGSKLPIVLPYQQLIHTLLYLCYGNDMGSFSYRKTVGVRCQNLYHTSS